MAVDGAPKPEYDYTAAVTETLREAGHPLSSDELWEKLMQRTDIPAANREMYAVPSLRPFVILGIVANLTFQATEGDDGYGSRLIPMQDGYWLSEWGPLPLEEQRFRQELAEEIARRASDPTPPVWPELDPYPKTSMASEAELQKVAEKLVMHRSLLRQQRFGEFRLSEAAGRAAMKSIEEAGLADTHRRIHEERERKIAVLMAWYGDAVRRTDGADPQDLDTLASVGFIRDPEERAWEAEPGFVTMRMDDEGVGVVAPTSTLRFTPDARYDELHELITGFVKEVPFPHPLLRVADSLVQGTNASSPPSTLPASSDRYPSELDSEVASAIEMKRQGRFLDSAATYVSLSRRERTIYAGILMSLYKTAACGGDLVNAVRLLERGHKIWTPRTDQPAVPAEIAWNFEDHMGRLFRATTSPSTLHEYLRDLSGNPAYQMPRDWAQMTGEVHAFLELREQAKEPALKQLLKNIEESNRTKPTSGCYVATSVYGDYEAPEVRVLRRWRDQVLLRSPFGRLCVRFYYAVSPGLVRAVGDRKSFRVPSRWILDRLVRTLGF